MYTQFSEGVKPLMDYLPEQFTLYSLHEHVHFREENMKSSTEQYFICL